MGLTRHAATRCSRSRFPSSDESRPRRLVSSRLVAYRSSVSWVSLWCSRVWGRLSSPPPGRFRQSRRRICRAEIRRTEGVEASALGRETRNTQDNNITTTFVQLNVHSCNACNAAQCSGFEQVQASGGAPGRGGVNPLGFSPALLRGGDGRLGRSLDPILIYSQSTIHGQ